MSQSAIQEKIKNYFDNWPELPPLEPFEVDFFKLEQLEEEARRNEPKRKKTYISFEAEGYALYICIDESWHYMDPYVRHMWLDHTMRRAKKEIICTGGFFKYLHKVQEALEGDTLDYLMRTLKAYNDYYEGMAPCTDLKVAIVDEEMKRRRELENASVIMERKQNGI